MGDVVKLTAPNGALVSVAADKEQQYVAAGYRPAKSPEKPQSSSRRSGSSKK